MGVVQAFLIVFLVLLLLGALPKCC